MKLSIVVIVVLVAGMTRAQGIPTLRTTREITPEFPIVGFRLVDLTGDGHQEVLVIGSAGEVRTWHHDRIMADTASQPRGTLTLPDPVHSLLALADMTGQGGTPQLIVASTRGVHAFRAKPDGSFDPEGILLTPEGRRRRARFRLRTGNPVFAPICSDVNGDGLPDMVLPVGDECELWMNPGKTPERTKAAFGLPLLRRAARLGVRVHRQLRYIGGELSDVYESSFLIPRLRTQDINADGREDVIVEEGSRHHAFHLQKEDGSIPAKPDVSLDLSVFRDTTPPASLRPGHTLAGGDRQTMQSRDLDGDGIPDYVIAHRRKVWVFHGTKEGPQFQKPSQILKSSDDITTMMLLNLDGAGRCDLVAIKVQVPTIATLILGTLGDFSVDVACLGYAGTDNRRFAIKPKWRSEITVRLPSIVRIMRDPDAILRRFEEVGERFVLASEADLDGDGKPEIVQHDTTANQLKIWLGIHAATDSNSRDKDALLRKILFEDTNRVWNIDRLVEWLGKLADTQIAQRMGGRKADLLWPLRPTESFLFQRFELGDLNGDHRAELVIHHAPTKPGGKAVLEILELSGTKKRAK